MKTERPDSAPYNYARDRFFADSRDENVALFRELAESMDQPIETAFGGRDDDDVWITLPRSEGYFLVFYSWSHVMEVRAGLPYPLVAHVDVERPEIEVLSDTTPTLADLQGAVAIAWVQLKTSIAKSPLEQIAEKKAYAEEVGSRDLRVTLVDPNAPPTSWPIATLALVLFAAMFFCQLHEMYWYATLLGAALIVVPFALALHRSGVSTTRKITPIELGQLYVLRAEEIELLTRIPDPGWNATELRMWARTNAKEAHILRGIAYMRAALLFAHADTPELGEVLRHITSVLPHFRSYHTVTHQELYADLVKSVAKSKWAVSYYTHLVSEMQSAWDTAERTP